MNKFTLATNVEPGAEAWTGYGRHTLKNDSGVVADLVEYVNAENQHACFCWDPSAVAVPPDWDTADWGMDLAELPRTLPRFDGLVILTLALLAMVGGAVILAATLIILEAITK